MKERAYSDFSAAMAARGSPVRRPLGGTIEITRRCPLDCAHCYNNLPMSDGEARRGELSLEELTRIMSELADAGCMWLTLSGGEILARKDFLDIYARAKELGFLVTLFTNGTLITPAIADAFAAHRPFRIEITLYGRTRETYEALTGVRGSFDRCMRGIALLRERKLSLVLKSVGVSTNAHEMDAMRRFAEDELGVGFKHDSLVAPRIDEGLSPLAVRLSPEDVVALDMQDPKRLDGWREFAGTHNRPIAIDVRDQAYHCGAGVSAWAIDPEGKLTLCVLSHRDAFDLRRGSFAEGWAFLHRVRTRLATRKTKCTDCALKAMCGMCPATAELEGGDPEEPVDFLCQVAHLRAAILALDVPAHGECAYCKSGVAHGVIEAAAARLRASGARLSSSRGKSLPMAERSGASSCGSGACSSCGAG